MMRNEWHGKQHDCCQNHYRYVHLSFHFFVDSKTTFRVQIYAFTFATQLQRWNSHCLNTLLTRMLLNALSIASMVTPTSANTTTPASSSRAAGKTSALSWPSAARVGKNSHPTGTTHTAALKQTAILRTPLPNFQKKAHDFFAKHHCFSLFSPYFFQHTPRSAEKTPRIAEKTDTFDQH